MSLAPGTRLGPYEVVAAIGEGGMGQVFRARDTRLQRDVALKVLPALFAADPERRARFEREAQVLASLNHPHIAAIHGVEDADGVQALVLEFVDGETLADRLARGPIALDEALAIARQIAEAMEAAHDHGVVHRDLKPANVKVRPDGSVKVLDFGLAKLADAASPDSSQNLSPSIAPTMRTPALMTAAGVIMGTAAYMSPEQARGRMTDRRSDIWSFGCLLFEMLAGRRAFEAGETVSDAVAAVLRADPDWTALPADTPAGVRTLLRRCLQKDVGKRLPHIGVARLELEDPGGSAPMADIDTGTGRSASTAVLPWLVAGASAVAAVAAIAWAAPWRAEPAPPEMRVELVTPPTFDDVSLALSPDGRQVVFAGLDQSVSRLWLRRLDSPTSTVLPGTDGAEHPFWSPDGRTIAFFARGRLMRLDLSGGAAESVAVAANGRGGAWSEDGTIVFSGVASGPLYRVPAAGGEPVPATVLGPDQLGHRFPQFIPGTRSFLFFAVARARGDGGGVFLGSLDSPTTVEVLATETSARFIPPDWLLTADAEGVFARHLDIRTGRLAGERLRLRVNVAFDPVFSSSGIAVSPSGTIAFRAAGGVGRQLQWFDRAGRALGGLGPTDGTLFNLDLSPDGRQVAVRRTADNNGDIWILDRDRATRFTFHNATDDYPHWGPDGRSLVFRRSTNFTVHRKNANGSGAEDTVWSNEVNKAPTDVSPDGRLLLAITLDPKTSSDLWLVPLDGAGEPRAFLETPFTERNGQFSPDGRFVAYQSDESGRPEIYIRPLDGTGQWQVSGEGGVAPRWRHDGREIYFVSPLGAMMAAPVTLGDGAAQPGRPVELFRPGIVNAGTSGVGVQWQYDVAGDGRFLINTTSAATSSVLHLILNWNPTRGDSGAP